MKNCDLVLVNANIAIPSGESFIGWLSVSGGKIQGLGVDSPPSAAVVVDCEGKMVLPGIVDIHAHFRDPGNEYKEDFISGSMAAAFGGVTTVVDMPNTGNYVLTPEDVREKVDYLEGRSYVDYGLYGMLGNSAEFMDELIETGVCGLKWLMGYGGLDGKSATRPQLIEALKAAARTGMLIGLHAESYEWILELEEKLKAEGRIDAAAHNDSRPPYVEAIGVAEAMILGHEAGTRMHVHHLTSDYALTVTRSLSEGLGMPVTVEVCPQHLFLDASDVDRWGTRSRVNPPIRSAADAKALWDAVVSGEVDCVATDHAPHAMNEKDVDEIWQARPGLLGVETVFGLMFSEVVDGRLPLKRYLEVMCQGPADIVGLGDRKGRLEEGYDADLVVVDSERSGVFRPESLHSKNPFTLYEGRPYKGEITAVYLRGALVVERGALVGGRNGQYLQASVAQMT